MLEVPEGVWKWIDANLKDVGRIATAAETIAHELKQIRVELQNDEKKG